MLFLRADSTQNHPDFIFSPPNKNQYIYALRLWRTVNLLLVIIFSPWLEIGPTGEKEEGEIAGHRHTEGAEITRKFWQTVKEKFQNNTYTNFKEFPYSLPPHPHEMLFSFVIHHHHHQYHFITSRSQSGGFDESTS
jgi:hypothetical protein